MLLLESLPKAANSRDPNPKLDEDNVVVAYGRFSRQLSSPL